MMTHCKSLALLLLATVALSACGPLKDAVNPYEENFKCRASTDTGECVDTPTAYKEARYPDPDLEKGSERKATGARLTAQDQRYRTLVSLLEQPRKPLLQPPKILRVLLLPYRGENGELFMTRYVYVKIEDSRWILTDLSEK